MFLSVTIVHARRCEWQELDDDNRVRKGWDRQDWQVMKLLYMPNSITPHCSIVFLFKGANCFKGNSHGFKIACGVVLKRHTSENGLKNLLCSWPLLMVSPSISLALRYVSSRLRVVSSDLIRVISVSRRAYLCRHAELQPCRICALILGSALLELQRVVSNHSCA